MCFHMQQSKKAVELENRFKATLGAGINFAQGDHINGFDFPYLNTISNTSPQTITSMQWGLIPHWAKNHTIQKSTLNAKVETVFEKPSFKSCINQRCMILANGFYEWQWLDSKGKDKQKYRLSLPNNEAFAFAGLWSKWHSKILQADIYSFTILTTKATGIMAEIHNSKQRMPIILEPSEEEYWIHNKKMENFRNRNTQLHAEAI